MLPPSPSWRTPSDYRLSHWPDEPFFERDRLAECGFAWESCVIGGRTASFGSVTVRFGLGIQKWPALSNEGNYPERAKPKLWSTTYFTRMTHVQKLCTAAFWSAAGIDRYGAEALKPDKFLGYRVYNPGEAVSRSDGGISWGDSSWERDDDSDGIVRPEPSGD